MSWMTRWMSRRLLTALFDPLHVAYFAADALPETTNVRSSRRQRLGAFTYYRHGEAGVAAAGGIALGDVESTLTAIVEEWKRQ